MNICIVNDSFQMGGVQKVVIELANSLQKRGHNISLIDFSGRNIFFYHVNENINKPKVIRPRSIKRKIISKIVFLINDLINLDNKVSILYREQINDLIQYLNENKFDVIIMNQGVLTAVIPFIKEAIPQIKVVAWQHNDYDIYINKYYKKIIRDYLTGANQADLIVCLTEVEQKKYRQLNRNTTYIYNPLTISNKNKLVSTLTEKIIVFVGRLIMETKGLDYLIKIAQKLEDGWKIVVAGDGPDKEKFSKMIKNNNLEDKIILKGKLENEQLTKLYLSGSIFISTSRWEGFGLVITEAMNFGLPVVSFDNTGPREILKNGEFGILVEKNNIEQFINNLLILTSNIEKRKKLQQKSLERVRDFNIEYISSKWESALERLVNGS